MAQIGQCTDNSTIAPVAILSGHTHHQFFELTVHLRTTGVTSPFRAVGLAGDQPTVPSKHGVPIGRIRYVRETLAPKPMPDLCEGDSVDVR